MTNIVTPAACSAQTKGRLPVEDTEWIHYTLSDSYIRSVSGHILTIYSETDNAWSAHVVGERGNWNRQRFASLHEAQAWCERQAAQVMMGDSPIERW